MSPGATALWARSCFASKTIRHQTSSLVPKSRSQVQLGNEEQSSFPNQFVQTDQTHHSFRINLRLRAKRRNTAALHNVAVVPSAAVRLRLGVRRCSAAFRSASITPRLAPTRLTSSADPSRFATVFLPGRNG
jgi:hypothetical protein